MDAAGGSQTALMVCAYRARASRWPQPLFVDPWAAALAGSDGDDLARRFDERWPHMETWLALRVATIDRLVGLLRRSAWVRQFVVLGAGYDTRAARLAVAGDLFVEVDHPATQVAKRARLAGLAGYPAAAARYAPCDFEAGDDVVAVLDEAGLDRSQPTLVIWEGVVPYLTEAAVRATATTLARALPRGFVVFDFVGKKLVHTEADGLKAADRAMRDYVGDLGEPLRFGANDIVPLLADCGFRWTRVHSFDELALEMIGDYRRERQFRFQQLAIASPTVPPAGLWP